MSKSESLRFSPVNRNILFKVHSNLTRLIRDWGKGGGVPLSYQRMTTKTIKRQVRPCVVFDVSTVVRNKVTKRVPEL